MSPRSHEIRTHNCVDVPNVCRRPRIDIDRICSDEIYNLLRAFYVYVCVCVCASAFCMEETKLTDENEYEKRYERGVIGSTASNLKGEGLI